MDQIVNEAELVHAVVAQLVEDGLLHLACEVSCSLQLQRQVLQADLLRASPIGRTPQRRNRFALLAAHVEVEQRARPLQIGGQS